MLAHANKNRGMDGKIVAGGTSDITDDCDCVYLLDEVSRTATTKTVIFENAKKRGNNAQEMSFSYALSGENYGELLVSVKPLDFETIERTKKELLINARIEKDKHAIEAITEGIKQGHNKRTDLVQFAMDKNNFGVSRQKVWEVLDRYTGEKLSSSSLWRVQIADKNAKIYYLLTAENIPTDYQRIKSGY